jgi:hypothetical protein
MDGLRNEEVLENNSTGEVRVVFAFHTCTKGPVHIVVKYFDPIQKERCTLKIFQGSYEMVRSHWRTLTKVRGLAAEHYFRCARGTIRYLVEAVLTRV